VLLRASGVRNHNNTKTFRGTDGPAIEWADGTKLWYQNGRRHRTDGPAVEWTSGNREWYQNDKFHRTDGPAIEYANSDRLWYQNGKLHRTDGPAVEMASGTKEYWVEGKRVESLPDNCAGKIVEIDGKRYKLLELL